MGSQLYTPLARILFLRLKDRQSLHSPYPYFRSSPRASCLMHLSHSTLQVPGKRTLILGFHASSMDGTHLGHMDTDMYKYTPSMHPHP